MNVFSYDFKTSINLIVDYYKETNMKFPDCFLYSYNIEYVSTST